MSYGEFGTGAIPRPAQATDYQLELLPEVAERVGALPDQWGAWHISGVPPHVKINQGPIPKCVASSQCIVQSFNDSKDLGVWQTYDDQEHYVACGGDGRTGIFTDRSLKRCVELGLLRVGTNRRFRVASYLWAPQQARRFRETLCAAVMELGPCVVATLLPGNFGWDSSDNPGGIETYHQMALVGWDGLSDDGWAVFLNSWGEGFGNRGFVRLKWRYLEGGGSFQNRLVYAYTVTDFRDGSVVPPPPPKKKTVTVTAVGTGEAAARVNKGSTLVYDSAIFTVESVTVKEETEPDPVDPPDPIDPTGELVISAGVDRVSPIFTKLTVTVSADGQPAPAAVKIFIGSTPIGYLFYNGINPKSMTVGAGRGTVLTLNASQPNSSRTGRLQVVI